MKKLITLGTVTLLLVAVVPASAQTFGFGAHAGVSIPTGDYGATDDFATDGFAELGFSGGLDLWYPLGMAPGLSWYTSVDAIAHSVDDPDVDGGYLYFPLMTGLRYDIPVGAVGLFVNGQVGAVLSRPPSIGDVDGDFGTDFGFNFGGGLQINQNIYAGLKYYPLGDVEFSYDEPQGAFEKSVSFFDIYLGFGVR
jgi:opacity protein-like surface antigen